jgi:hypothetical protein
MTSTELFLLAALLASWGYALVVCLPHVQIRRKEPGIGEALRDAYKLPVIRSQPGAERQREAGQ